MNELEDGDYIAFQELIIVGAVKRFIENGEKRISMVKGARTIVDEGAKDSSVSERGAWRQLELGLS